VIDLEIIKPSTAEDGVMNCDSFYVR